MPVQTHLIAPRIIEVLQASACRTAHAVSEWTQPCTHAKIHLCCLQFLTYAAYRLQLESAFLADELSSAAAAKEDLRSKRLSLSDTAGLNGIAGKGVQSEDGKTERSSAQVSLAHCE